MLSESLGSSVYANTVMTDGPVGYWRLGEASGTTTSDAMSPGVPGQYVPFLTGGPLPTLGTPGALVGDPDGAPSFFSAGFQNRTSTNYVVVPHNATQTASSGALTVEEWITIPTGECSTEAPAALASPFLKSSGALQDGYGFYYYANSIYFYVNDLNNRVGVELPSSTPQSLSQFHYIAGTYDGTALKFYWDGTPAGSVPMSGPVNASTAPLTFGKGYSVVGWNGKIDEVALYNKALSASQVQAHYQAALGPALNGPLVLSGHVLDGAGHAVVGARVDLRGAAQSVRFTDFTGGYSFHVNAGNYTLTPAAPCTVTPTSAAPNVQANTVQDFSATSSGCAASAAFGKSVTGSSLALSQNGAQLGFTYANVEQRANATDAQARLQEIAAERPEPSQALTIAGNPAIERQVTLLSPGTLDADSDGEPEPVLTITTAIVVGTQIVRFESQLDADADGTTIAKFIYAGRNFTLDELPDLHGPAPTPIGSLVNSFTRASPPANSFVASEATGNQWGELQIAASKTSNAVLYGLQGGVALFSTDGGVSTGRSAMTLLPPPGATMVTFRTDPTVAIGAPNGAGSQTFYYMDMVEDGTKTPNVWALELFKSTDGGQNFNVPFVFPITCGVPGETCALPDQPQLAADTVHRALGPPGGGDQLYVTFRYQTGPGKEGQAIACSPNGGAPWTDAARFGQSSWTINKDELITKHTGVAFPRIAVAPDGSVFVAYQTDAGDGTATLSVHKFSSCADRFQPSFETVTDANGATRNAFPVVAVTKFGNIKPMAGLDRTPSGNYGIAFDDRDSNGKTVYLTYIDESTASGGVATDDVHVAKSIDGGKTWTQNIIVTPTGSGSRAFLPAICSTNGNVFVSWYDRRGATPAASDLTSYFWASVVGTDQLAVGTVVDASGGRPDPECTSGFPSSVREYRINASTPELGPTIETGCPSSELFPGAKGGLCQSPIPCLFGVSPSCGSQHACDFRNPVCPVDANLNAWEALYGLPPPNQPEQCMVGTGAPKYGDYNGSACAGGKLFMAWASSTPPAGACGPPGSRCSQAADCCGGGNCINQVCTAGTVECQVNGFGCSVNADCCSQICDPGGVCLAQVGIYTSSSPVSARLPPATFGIGLRDTCSVDVRNGVECWGADDEGEDGTVDKTQHLSPVCTQSANQGQVASAVAMGAGHACAIFPSDAGKVRCWGDNSFGQLGTAASGLANGTSTVVNGLPAADASSEIAAGGGLTCVLYNGSGDLWCWGENRFGQLGIGTTTTGPNPTPAKIATLPPVVQVAIAPSGAFLCALAQMGGVYCWGLNQWGNLGNGSSNPASTPQPVSSPSAPGATLSNVFSIGVGNMHACAVVECAPNPVSHAPCGTLMCWGNNASSQLGIGDASTGAAPQGQWLPVQATELNGILDPPAMVVGADSSTCILTTTSRSVYCWGDNTLGELGDGTTTSSAAPVFAGTVNGASAIAAGETRVCAHFGSGLTCWGGGPIGDGTNTSANAPKDVPFAQHCP